MIPDPAAKAEREARNALLQFDEVRIIAAKQLGALKVSSDLVREFQRIAIDGIDDCAGQFRRSPIFIAGTTHRPPHAPDVPQLVEDMCEYANAAGNKPIHCAAYLMWRTNWIHPFAGGNGRTSRALSYLALCAGYGLILPGTDTVPDQIVRDRGPYYSALDAADAAYARGVLDVSALEATLEVMLTRQLAST